MASSSRGLNAKTLCQVRVGNMVVSRQLKDVKGPRSGRPRPPHLRAVVCCWARAGFVSCTRGNDHKLINTIVNASYAIVSCRTRPRSGFD